MSILRSILTIFGAIFLASCGNSGEYYEKTPEQVTHAIKSAHLPTHVLGKQIKRSRVTQPAPDTVVTTLLGEGGREMMHFVTTVTPVANWPRALRKSRSVKAAASGGAAREGIFTTALI